MNLEQTWRWFGPSDPITLNQIRQTGATGIVTALHHIPNGDLWPLDEIMKIKNQIDQAGLRWSVVESVPVHEDIKRKTGNFREYINNYQQSLRNLAECGITVVCYNFMPILDWTRTNLHYMVEDGSTALRFDETDLAAFDIYILKRDNAEKSYSADIIKRAGKKFRAMDNATTEQLIETILAGLPGSVENYTLSEFREMLATYRGITESDLRQHLYYFLKEVIPVAEECGIRMAIHPDDPPFAMFGLPRVVSTETDALELLSAVDSPSNGLTFCTGSYGARGDNDLPGIVKRLGRRIHFIHLRSVQREQDHSFHEANHLEGSAEMVSVMAEIIREQIRRKRDGRDDISIPVRPDHGHRMLYDFDHEHYPGYSLVGRLRGLAELRGLELGVRSVLAPDE